jgi:hypothetical protein
MFELFRTFQGIITYLYFVNLSWILFEINEKVLSVLSPYSCTNPVPSE